MILDHDLSQADGRADADAEGQAQRRQREICGRCSTRCTRAERSAERPAANIARDAHRSQQTTAACSSGGARHRARPIPRAARARQRARQRIDGSLAGILLAGMIFLSLLCWGPIPLACLWLGSQADYLSGSVSLGILVSFVGAVRPPVRRARRSCKRLDSAGSSSAAPPGTTSARGALGRVSAYRGRVRRCVRAVVPRHPRTRRKPGLPRRKPA